LRDNNSLGAQLHDAISDVNIDKVRQLLKQGVDPNHHSRQQSVRAGGREYFVYTRDGQPVPEPDWDVNVGTYQPTRPLSLVAFMLSSAVFFHEDVGIETNEEFQEALRDLAKVLIDEGADLIPAVRIMEARYGPLSSYGKEFDDDDEYGYPAMKLVWQARQSVERIREDCRNGSFDFASYLSGKPNNGKKSDFFLTENAIMASNELRPYYEEYRRREDLWKDAEQVSLSNGAVLQIVGLESTTHTLFGRIHHLKQLEDTYSIQQVVEYMLEQVHLQNQKLSPSDLLSIGAVCKLYPSSGSARKMKRDRQYLDHSTDPLKPNIESLRVHFRPSHFPAAYSVDWTLPQYHSLKPSKPFAILDWNLDFGYAVINKPCGLPSHATVDNGVENVLYHVQQQLVLHGFDGKPSLPQRLDIETEGLLLVALKPAFSSYVGQLLEKKSLIAESHDMHKQYKCLVCLNSLQQRENLIQQLKSTTRSEGLLVEHYMDPNSVAPKTFQSKPQEGWLRCALRILDIGPPMKWKAADGNAKDDEEIFMQVRVELLTGRTHQIRGQFAAMSMSLVGDPLYGPQFCDISEWDVRRNRRNAQKRQVERLGLQCCVTSFPKPRWHFDAKKKRNVLLKDESGGNNTCTFQLDKSWWSDSLVPSADRL
jgi:23S rRNA-/tRNA-specific pseudouridylate synthase